MKPAMNEVRSVLISLRSVYMFSPKHPGTLPQALVTENHPSLAYRLHSITKSRHVGVPRKGQDMFEVKPYAQQGIEAEHCPRSLVACVWILIPFTTADMAHVTTR